MAADHTVVAVQHALNDLVHRSRLKDLDTFVPRISREIAERLESAESLGSAVEVALQSVKTSFFRVNNISREGWIQDAAQCLESIANVHVRSIRDLLEAFARYAEKREAWNLKQDPSEENARGLVRTFLASEGPVFSEAQIGSGKTDVLLLRPGGQTPEIVEIKVPKSSTEFEDGLLAASQYAQAEGAVTVYYVVFDHCSDLNSPRFMKTAVSMRRVDGVNIQCIRVRVAQEPPSITGRARRRRSKDR